MTGSTLGLASVTTALNKNLSGRLPKILNDTQLKSVLSSTSAISTSESSGTGGVWAGVGSAIKDSDRVYGGAILDFVIDLELEKATDGYT
ncbi:hypothetical protein BTUL_0247g00040 [Botrytis tulipae]|uniref:Uncharacterized protein n=1 Tax=Botrytis tulipae TaxID=87230 RepID=A0A4Z1EEH7_9HELO|nr:hypothetical protein BTUL_0247g00040 [Botrytis tulipae]